MFPDYYLGFSLFSREWGAYLSTRLWFSLLSPEPQHPIDKKILLINHYLSFINLTICFL